MAELETDAMSRRCMGRRMAAIEKMTAEVQSWAAQRNKKNHRSLAVYHRRCPCAMLPRPLPFMYNLRE